MCNGLNYEVECSSIGSKGRGKKKVTSLYFLPIGIARDQRELNKINRILGFAELELLLDLRWERESKPK